MSARCDVKGAAPGAPGAEEPPQHDFRQRQDDDAQRRERDDAILNPREEAGRAYGRQFAHLLLAFR